MIDGTALLFDGVDEPVPLELGYWPDLRGSSEDADARVDEEAALVPELNEGAESEDDDPEFETDVLAKEALELGGATPPARGAETLFCGGEGPATVECEPWSRGSPVGGAIMGENGICEKSMPAMPGAGLNFAVAGEMRTAERQGQR